MGERRETGKKPKLANELHLEFTTGWEWRMGTNRTNKQYVPGIRSNAPELPTTNVGARTIRVRSTSKLHGTTGHVPTAKLANWRIPVSSAPRNIRNNSYTTRIRTRKDNRSQRVNGYPIGNERGYNVTTALVEAWPIQASNSKNRTRTVFPQTRNHGTGHDKRG